LPVRPEKVASWERDMTFGDADMMPFDDEEEEDDYINDDDNDEDYDPDGSDT
jgi:hypothetical protein